MFLVRYKRLWLCSFLLCTFLLFVLGTAPVSADSFHSGNAIDIADVKMTDVELQFVEKAKQLETSLEQERYNEARLLLLQLQQLFPQLSFSERTSVEGIQSISETFIHLKQLLSAVQLQPQKIVHTAHQFSLAADALIYAGQQEQSRWKIRLSELAAYLDTVRQTEDVPDASTAEMLLKEYDVLRPALAVRESSHVIGQLDALYQQMKQLKLQQQPAKDEWAVLLGQLSDLYRQILLGKDRPTVAETLRHPLSQLMIGLAAFLILALSYTAWCYRTFRRTW